MPQYDVIIQMGVSPAVETRQPRARGPHEKSRTERVVADHLVGALSLVQEMIDAEGGDQRVVGVEEVFVLGEVSDEALMGVLTDPELQVDHFEPGEYAGVKIARGNDMPRVLVRIATALRESGIVPGLDVSPVYELDGSGPCYALVEVRDDANETSRVSGRQIGYFLMDGKNLEDMAAVLAATRSVLGVVRDDGLL